jgi:hypothetical protein
MRRRKGDWRYCRRCRPLRMPKRIIRTQCAGKTFPSSSQSSRDAISTRYVRVSDIAATPTTRISDPRRGSCGPALFSTGKRKRRKKKKRKERKTREPDLIELRTCSSAAQAICLRRTQYSVHFTENEILYLRT